MNITTINEGLAVLEVLSSLLVSERPDKNTPGRYVSVLTDEEFREIKEKAVKLAKSLPDEFSESTEDSAHP